MNLNQYGGRSGLPLPLPFPLGLRSRLTFLVDGWDRMSVSWMVSCRMSVVACLNVTPGRICIASC